MARREFLWELETDTEIVFLKIFKKSTSRDLTVHLGGGMTCDFKKTMRMLYGIFLQLKTQIIFQLSYVCVQYKII